MLRAVTYLVLINWPKTALALPTARANLSELALAGLRIRPAIRLPVAAGGSAMADKGENFIILFNFLPHLSPLLVFLGAPLYATASLPLHYRYATVALLGQSVISFT